MNYTLALKNTSVKLSSKKLAHLSYRQFAKMFIFHLHSYLHNNQINFIVFAASLRKQKSSRPNSLDSCFFATVQYALAHCIKKRTRRRCVTTEKDGIRTHTSGATTCMIPFHHIFFSDYLHYNKYLPGGQALLKNFFLVTKKV